MEGCSGCRQDAKEWKDAGGADRTLKNGRSGDRKYFCLLKIVQSESGAHPASYALRNRSSVPGVKCPEREVGHSVPSSVQIYLVSPAGLHGFLKDNFTLTFTFYVS
jgi:hypothetical protein